MIPKSEILNLSKRKGETPLAMLRRFRKAFPEYEKEALSYLGRLDPLASGVVLTAVGEENKNRQAYLHLDKTYECECVLGFQTDTHDALGRVTSVSQEDFTTGLESLKEKVLNAIGTFLGKQLQSYPAYSSKPVEGKPLWQWAREGRLGEIEIPQKEIEVFSIELKSISLIGKSELMKSIEETIRLVEGDFRQEEIIESWRKALSLARVDEFPVIRLNICSGSGTYIRGLASEIGLKLATGAVLTSLSRTKVGDYALADSIVF